MKTIVLKSIFVQNLSFLNGIVVDFEFFSADISLQMDKDTLTVIFYVHFEGRFYFGTEMSATSLNFKIVKI